MNVVNLQDRIVKFYNYLLKKEKMWRTRDSYVLNLCRPKKGSCVVICLFGASIFGNGFSSFTDSMLG